MIKELGKEVLHDMVAVNNWLDNKVFSDGPKTSKKGVIMANKGKLIRFTTSDGRQVKFRQKPEPAPDPVVTTTVAPAPEPRPVYVSKRRMPRLTAKRPRLKR